MIHAGKRARVRKIRAGLRAAKNRSGTTIFDMRIEFYAKFGTSCVGVHPCEKSKIELKIDVLAKVASSEASGTWTPGQRNRRPAAHLDAPGAEIWVSKNRIVSIFPKLPEIDQKPSQTMFGGVCVHFRCFLGCKAMIFVIILVAQRS